MNLSGRNHLSITLALATSVVSLLGDAAHANGRFRPRRAQPASPAREVREARNDRAQPARGYTQRANAPRWERSMVRMRENAPLRGKDVFERHNLFSGLRAGSHTLISYDAEGGATSMTDPRSEFAMIEAYDSSPGRVHLLAITTDADYQPISLFDTPASKAPVIGRMFRTILNAPRLPAVSGLSRPSHFDQWTANISLPGKMTIPYLHVHGENKVHHGVQPSIDTTKVTDWDAFAVDNGYVVDASRSGNGFTVYNHPGRGPNRWRTLVVADKRLGRPSQLTAQADDLIGKMVMAGSDAVMSAEDREPGGHIEMFRDDQQLVVRVARREPHNALFDLLGLRY